MSRTRLRASLALVAALGAAGACADGGAGAGGGGGATGTTTQTGECSHASDCPGSDSTCAYRVCGFGLCDMIYAPVLTTCSESGGLVCDGSGRCVECAPGAACTTGICQDGLCVAAHCGDGAVNGSETDVDCGGDCGPCADGRHCVAGDDCQSGVCVNTVCAAPSCGDGHVNGAEACDDGNLAPFDGCYACRADAPHLLLSEVVVAPTGDELVEIYNPTAATVSLERVYLADYAGYHAIAVGGGAPVASDFRIRFPAGTSLGAHAFAVVSLHGAAGFAASYGQAPDYDCDPADPGAPDMLGEHGASSGLTNTDEMLVLFGWDGQSALVADLDYVLYGSAVHAADKSGITVGGQSYAADTPAAAQSVAPAPASGSSLQRCDPSEGAEKAFGGNGLLGHDETSEPCAATWKTLALRTPGAAPPAGACP
ncbi:MAG: DUF4215 domain-containing protein [Polyangiaceae bacterium]|nr:DUF4215 domain-containing protein [Polyangiaceae bacterium]